MAIIWYLLLLSVGKNAPFSRRQSAVMLIIWCFVAACFLTWGHIISDDFASIVRRCCLSAATPGGVVLYDHNNNNNNNDHDDDNIIYTRGAFFPAVYYIIRAYLYIIIWVHYNILFTRIYIYIYWSLEGNGHAYNILYCNTYLYTSYIYVQHEYNITAKGHHHVIIPH